MKQPVQRKLTNEILIHVIAWCVYVFYAQNLFLNTHPGEFALIPVIIFYLLSAAVFYTFACFITPQLVKRKSRLNSFIQVAIVLITYILLDYLNENVLAVYAYNLPPLKMTFLNFCCVVFWHFIKYAFWGVGYFAIWERFRLIKNSYEQRLSIEKLEKELLEKRTIEAEQDKLKYEYAFLRSQINPHFLYNTINVLKGKIQKHDPEAADCLAQFGKLMEYAVTNEGPSGLVSAELELENMKRLIYLHQYVYDNSLQIELSISGEMGGKIPPHVFLTLTENALKYGELLNKAQPLRISVKGIDNDFLIFSIQNQKRTGIVNSQSSGLGLTNLKKRLEALYAGFYELNILDSDDQYSTILTLKT